jgi:xylulose-5-phosphate/fructose-6-phosphate phosphoketolase
MIYISGPGHSGQALIANSYIEGTYSEVYPDITRNEEGLKKLFKRFSFPGGTSSHVAPEVPGSINEGGELGYSLSHAFGAVLDNPDLIVACIVGDGEAETGPLATSWHGNKFINPKKDGIVLPILHLNGYKIANPTIFSRISEEELLSFFKGCGWDPIIVDVRDVDNYHELMANAMDEASTKINKIRNDAKKNKTFVRPMYPMIILKSKKGWTCPKKLNDKEAEGTFRVHQVPINFEKADRDLKILTDWLKSYHPEELFNKDGSIQKDIVDFAPKGESRMSASKYANGGLLLKNIKVPDFTNYKIKVDRGITKASDMMVLGEYIRDVIKLNKDNFRIFGPDEALSNRLNRVFDVTERKWNAEVFKNDELLSSEGKIFDSYLSEHMCEGMLEGYLLTGRHGFMHSYEAFIRIVDSMASQHAKWLKVCNEIPWREDIASLNYILTSHIWQQDHNGFTHQDPGFLNHLATKKADTVRMYFPIDANTLLSSFDHVIQTKNYINAIVASKHPSIQWLSMDEAKIHCKNGLGIFEWASNKPANPDIVLASCGDTPNLEVIAAAKILKEYCPHIHTRVVNVVDLMRLESNLKHPHGLTDKEYDKYFTTDKPIIFAFHGYPNLIHELTYNRTNHDLHVHGYMEEGTITTPFDMRVQNKIDRFNLVLDALKYVETTEEVKLTRNLMHKKLKEHKEYIVNEGIDLEEVRNWSMDS